MFLRSASGVELNNYFKSLQRLASQKGGIYQKIYNQDCEKIMQSHNGDGQIGGFLTGIRPRISPDPLSRINYMDPNTYCSVITQKGPWLDNSCKVRKNEIQMIQSIITNASKGSSIPGFFLSQVIRRFIELLFCCSKEWYNNAIKKERVKDTALILANTPHLTRIARDYIEKIMDVETEKYIKEYARMRREKGSGFKSEKAKMIERYGGDNLYATRLIDLIIDKSIQDDDII